MKILSSALLLSGSILLSGCDMEMSPEAKAKVEETTQAASELKKGADASVEELKNTFNTELQKTKENAINQTQNALTSSLSEETNKQIDSVKQKAEDVGNMKVSELLSFGGGSEVESEAEEEEEQ